MCQELNRCDLALKIAVLTELSTAMRHQSQAEYIYTAATIAGYGAICLGVGSTPATLSRGLVAAGAVLFMLLLSGAIGAAIEYNHVRYRRIHDARTEIAKAIHDASFDKDIIPDGWRNPSAPQGVNNAYSILAIATLGAVSFCLTFALSS